MTAYNVVIRSAARFLGSLLLARTIIQILIAKGLTDCLPSRLSQDADQMQAIRNRWSAQISNVREFRDRLLNFG
jgi:hypothetical protein